MRLLKKIVSILLTVIFISQSVCISYTTTTPLYKGDENDGGGQSGGVSGGGSLSSSKQGYIITIVDIGGNRISCSIDILKSNTGLEVFKSGGRMYTGVKGDRGEIGVSMVKGRDFVTLVERLTLYNIPYTFYFIFSHHILQPHLPFLLTL